MTDPTLTVVIPIRNRGGDRVANCLRSLRWQDAQAGSFEVLLSDYGSDDEHLYPLRALAEEYGARVVHTPTRGIWNRARALNLGIRAARGEYVFCTDADMIFARNFVSTLLAAQTRAGGRAMVLCKCRDLPEDVPEQRWEAGDYAQLLERASFRPRLGTGACQMAKRSFFFDVRGYDEKFVFWGAEDGDMTRRAIRFGLEPLWVEEQTSMLHQWHPTMRTQRPFLKFLNDARFHLTKYQLRKNGARWGLP